MRRWGRFSGEETTKILRSMLYRGAEVVQEVLTLACLSCTCARTSRSMLYRGSEVVREVQLLVYDEIHYLRDKERGVVWEESIILAPKQARFAFLSATIPNAKEFAMWIAKVGPRDVQSGA